MVGFGSRWFGKFPIPPAEKDVRKGCAVHGMDVYGVNRTFLCVVLFSVL